ncbi:MAG: DUF6056 family protein [Planctomycetota bacterium]
MAKRRVVDAEKQRLAGPLSAGSTQKQWLNPRLLWASGLFFAALPFLALTLFVHPQSDDFVYAVRTRVSGFWEANLFWYRIWSGRYTATALASMNPLVFDSFLLCKLVPAAVMVLLFCSVYFLIGALGASGVPRKQRAVMALVVVLLYLHQMPDLVQGIYWVVAPTYQLGNMLLLFLCGAMMKMDGARGAGRKKTLWCALAVLAIFIAVGTNELTMCLVLEMLVLTAVLNIRDREMRLSWALLVAAALLAAALVMLSPGNKARLAGVKQDFWFAVNSSVAQGLTYLAKWLLHSPILLLAVFFVPLAARLPRLRISGLTHPALAIPLFSATYLALFFPPCYGAGGVIEPRTVNVICFFFLIGFFVNVYLAVNCLVCKRNTAFPVLPAYVSGLIGAAILLMVFVCDSNLKNACEDLFTGTAYRYDQALQERYQIIRECGSPVCDVPALRDRPRTLFFQEMAVDERTDDENGFVYRDSYAVYFGKQRIRLAHSPFGNLVFQQRALDELLQQGRLDEAIIYGEETLRIRDDFAQVHFSLALALQQKGRVDEAIAHWRQVVKLRPTLPDGHFNLGNALFQRGKLDEAVVHYGDALRLRPAWVEAHCNLGLVLGSQGKKAEALAHFQEALRLNPGCQLARDKLAIIAKP